MNTTTSVHDSTHTGENVLHRCDACGREFRTLAALDDHVNSVGLVY
ncbi:hypothetical protein SAMN04487950_0811 [Halogranum rubrum]|uniref:C2H2-type domain-containing protein n=1 Tax=Halogranum rubrum TaxID=553466 RepID=A0A1I4BXZ6_9EURY|nr:hypothetical protein [Halogranum rubrum]SFK73047.1 hypothetical protein SAMN04487950_0811 [Halogranum rubrum]